MSLDKHFHNLSPEEQVIIRQVAMVPQFRILIEQEIRENRLAMSNLDMMDKDEFYKHALILKANIVGLTHMLDFLAYVKQQNQEPQEK